MGDNEAYLDDLLKSMNGEAKAGENDGNKMMTADEIAAMFAAMEQSAPAEEPVLVAEESVHIEEAVHTEEPVNTEEPLKIDEIVTEDVITENAISEEDTSMELPQDLLNDLLQKFEEQEAEEAEEEVEESSDVFDFSSDGQEAYTTENTQNLSAEEIEQLLANTEQMAENDVVEETMSFAEEEAVDEMSNEDLLALLGSLDSATESDEIDLFELNSEDTADLEQEVDVQDVMSGAAVLERTKERKERKKKEKLEKKAAKKALKEATREAKQAAKEAKKQQAQRQKATEEEMALEEVALEEVDFAESFTDEVATEGVETESVLDLFGNTESGQEESISLFDFAGLTADDAGDSDNQTEVVMSWDDPEEDAENDSTAPKAPVNGKKPKKEDNEKKKGGFFSKMFAFLTEEDEEPAKADDNQSILDELDAEDKEEDKKKKGKKGKASKGKKGKGGAEGEDEEKDEKKKGKKKKQPKPKKVKEIKLKPVEEERPSKRVSSKSVAVIVAFAATLFLVVFFAGSYFSTQLHRKEAKAAFERMDYASCYAGLYGMELSEEEREMLKHAELVLRMQRHIELYETYHEDEKELEALDSLMEAVAGYEEAYAKALDCGAGPEVAALYEEVLEILDASYGLSQQEAHKIADCESNVEYTRYLTALIGGGTDADISVPEDELQDVLPQEEELTNPDFAD